MYRFLPYLLLLSALCSGGRRSSYPTRFTVTANREHPIMVQWVFQALRNGLPLIIYPNHPILIGISRRVMMDIKMSRLGLRNHRWRRKALIGLGKVPDGVAASRVGGKRALAHLVRDRGVRRVCFHRYSVVRVQRRYYRLSPQRKHGRASVLIKAVRMRTVRRITGSSHPRDCTTSVSFVMPKRAGKMPCFA